jgi:hypothetical protein
LTAVGDDLVVDFVEASGVAGNEQDVSTERSQADRGGRADSAGGAGDEGDLGLERGHASTFDAGGAKWVRLLCAVDF